MAIVAERRRPVRAPWFWAYMAEVGPLLAGEPEVTMAAPAWAKGTEV
jgi:hypothetical protein